MAASQMSDAVANPITSSADRAADEAEAKPEQTQRPGRGTLLQPLTVLPKTQLPTIVDSALPKPTLLPSAHAAVDIGIGSPTSAAAVGLGAVSDPQPLPSPPAAAADSDQSQPQTVTIHAAPAEPAQSGTVSEPSLVVSTASVAGTSATANTTASQTEPASAEVSSVTAKPRSAKDSCMRCLRCTRGYMFPSRELGHAHSEEQYAFLLLSFGLSPFNFLTLAFLPPLFTNAGFLHANNEGRVNFLGFWILPTSIVSLYSTLITVVLTIVNPLAGALVDFTAHRKIALWWLNFLGILCGLGVLFVIDNDLWLVAVVFVLIYGVINSVEYTWMFAYFPEIAPDETERSRLAARSYAWTSCSQVFWAVVLAAMLLAVSVPSLSVDTGDFETSTSRQWALITPTGLNASAANGTKPWPLVCVDSPPASYAQAGGSDSALPLHGRAPFCFIEFSPSLAFTGLHSLRVSIPYANMTPAVVQWTSNADRSLYQDQYIFIVAPIRPGVRASPIAASRVQLSMAYGSAGETETSVFSLPLDSYTPLHMSETVPMSANAFSFSIVFLDAGSYNVDGVTAIPPISAIIPVKPRPAARPVPPGQWLATAAFAQQYRSLKAAIELPGVGIFLLSCMFWSDGFNTILSVVSTYLVYQVGIDPTIAAIALLVAALLAIPGTLIGAKLAKLIGLKRANILNLFILTVFIPVSYVALTPATQWAIWPMGPSLGVLNTIPRAIWGNMTPFGRESEFSGVFTFIGYVTSWSGPLVYTAINESSGSLGFAFLILTLYFFLSMLLACFTPPSEKLSRMAQSPAATTTTSNPAASTEAGSAGQKRGNDAATANTSVELASSAATTSQP